MSIFIDTSGFLAVLNKDDVHHPVAAKTWRDILTSEDELVTTNYVLLETFALVQNRLGMKALKVFQEDIFPVLRVEWIGIERHRAAVGILFAAARRKLSLVDCVSFEAMRLSDIATAFTFDKHFREQGFQCLPA
jgi:uncharacterized protein